MRLARPLATVRAPSGDVCNYPPGDMHRAPQRRGEGPSRRRRNARSRNIGRNLARCGRQWCRGGDLAGCQAIARPLIDVAFITLEEIV